MWNHLKPLAFCAASLTLAAGCTHTTGKAAVPALSAESAPVAPAALAVNPNKGIVAEVIQAGRYSYISVDNGSAKTWFAIPSSEVKVGQQVDVKRGMEVKNYTAKSLNRTFDSIFFTDGLNIITPAKAAADTIPSNHPSLGKLAYPGIKKVAFGKVSEVIKGSDFNFVSVERGEIKSWVALPATATVAVGEELQFLPGQEILGFTSSKINRTFDRIIFTDGVDKKK